MCFLFQAFTYVALPLSFRNSGVNVKFAEILKRLKTNVFPKTKKANKHAGGGLFAVVGWVCFLLYKFDVAIF